MRRGTRPRCAVPKDWPRGYALVIAADLPVRRLSDLHSGSGSRYPSHATYRGEPGGLLIGMPRRLPAGVGDQSVGCRCRIVKMVPLSHAGGGSVRLVHPWRPTEPPLDPGRSVNVCSPTAIQGAPPCWLCRCDHCRAPEARARPRLGRHDAAPVAGARGLTT